MSPGISIRPPAILFTGLLLLAACESGTGSEAGERAAIGDLIAALIDYDQAGSAASFESGAPAAGSGPDVTVTGSRNVPNGGSLLLGVSASTGFDRVIVTAVDAAGYWELTLPAPASEVLLILTTPPGLVPGPQVYRVAVAAPAGAIGRYTDHDIIVMEVGTGDVQVTVSWDAPSDVDLHVVEPSGEEIYFGNDLSATGGELDLESNLSCVIDGINSENVFWPGGSAPSGTYTIRVDYWSSCGESNTRYVVTLRKGAAAPQLFTGALTGAGDGGSEGAGVLVTQFDYP